MDWDALQVVLAIARSGTLSGAGIALGVTHTTVGRRLARLEQHLGVRLFDRLPDGFAVTDAGLELVEVAKTVEAQLHRVESSVRGQDAQLAGTLRVSTLDFLFEAFVDVFASFQATYPGIELTVTTTESEVSLFRREADVAFRLTNSPPETVVGRKVGAVRFAMYGHVDLVESSCDLNELPWLHWDERLEPQARWMDGFRSSVAERAATSVRLGESTLLRRAALRAGMGVHPLPCFEGDRYPELVQIGPLLSDFDRQLWLLTLPALRDTRRVRAFITHFAEALRGHAALAR